ncbi:MAG TPA: hypothetical protein DEF18_06460 [Muricauda sp.]|mgnify:CR=1 FL=1|uniref:DUF2158 domain-containing protein n=1 Tax=Flagellimonas aurea TaxID=2915619 RepID=A0ABS3GA11_9FLAO|nr:MULTISPECIES: hypothetical protein [Allomuricauda]MAO16593.1 hypothetical protein [Allomuricauda sp.]MBC72529.1 hypothetical protein [Allomuricauda sp.]MBO0356266.1 hypothetical protein [Allomuricauda aurea]HBU77727.1 hypothetical protein [Allomuricauda sp.]|tara:strand:- start:220 stop:501 length:282 start_codon:yes stop_codon:yes gene_type:complete
MARKFKPGDWVKVKGTSSGPKMEVSKYSAKKEPIFGFMDRDTYVECIWYRNGERRSRVFHQNRLSKVLDTKGIYKTSRTIDDQNNVEPRNEQK